MIRKSLLLFASFIVLMTACSSTTGKQTNNDTAPKVEEEVTGKPIYLTYETFLEKVWNFEENPQNWVYEGELPAVIDFYADWCAPCRKVAPIMDKLAKEYDGKLHIYKIDVDDEQKLAAVFRVQSIPSVLFTPVNGQPMMQAGALTEEMYRQIIDEELVNK
jgi:thioredoxin